MEPIRVLFMGTPDFAVPSLAALAGRVEAVRQLAGVVTRPDKPAGRGRQVAYAPVKQFAVEHGIPVFQPGPLRRPEALQQLRELAPDMIVVAAFGQILPPEVLALPRHGSLNVHASLLPRWRGASPINAAILAGDMETGVTVMLMDEGLDTGPVLAQRTTPIGPEETAGELSDRLANLGAALLVETIPRWLAGEITPKPQDEAQATLTRLLTKEDGRLDWARPGDHLARQVRAFTPWPGAFTTWDRRTLKVLRARAISAPNDLLPGTCFALQDPASVSLACVCGQGALALEVIQLEGKRALPVDEVLRGYPTLATATLGT
ncbi:MAG TPA: methionyl-tRNA formyltransferase [Ktedonobacterales bacterium]|jgi:methionyl-tRNA formyltransferase|nr:methionyl-tRNA formyltransferase [Ktedonobacterales bacterium]